MKAAEKDVYQSGPMKLVPLKKKQGRTTKAKTKTMTLSTAVFDFNTCGKKVDDDTTEGQFSTHKNHTQVCDCESYVAALKKNLLT